MLVIFQIPLLKVMKSIMNLIIINVFNNYFTDVGPSISLSISYVSGSIYD